MLNYILPPLTIAFVTGFILLSSPAIVNAANEDTKKDTAEVNEEPVYSVPDVEPVFPGGVKALRKYLNENIHYPGDLVEKEIEGRVVVTFIVEKDGSITNIENRSSIHEKLDKEAIRVIKEMPDWEPGEISDKPIRCRVNLPIRFSAD